MRSIFNHLPSSSSQQNRGRSKPTTPPFPQTMPHPRLTSYHNVRWARIVLVSNIFLAPNTSSGTPGLPGEKPYTPTYENKSIVAAVGYVGGGTRRTDRRGMIYHRGLDHFPESGLWHHGLSPTRWDPCKDVEIVEMQWLGTMY